MMTMMDRWRERRVVRMLARLFDDEQAGFSQLGRNDAQRRPPIAAKQLPAATGLSTMAPAWGAHNRRTLAL